MNTLNNYKYFLLNIYYSLYNISISIDKHY